MDALHDDGLPPFPPSSTFSHLALHSAAVGVLTPRKWADPAHQAFLFCPLSPLLNIDSLTPDAAPWQHTQPGRSGPENRRPLCSPRCPQPWAARARSNRLVWAPLPIGLCLIESVFEGEGAATLMSANYPDGFPEDELMTWQFVIPAHLRASVSFLHVNVSNCEKKEERVEYYIPGSTTNPEVFRLADKQPGNMAGSFNLSLQGCDQDAQNPGILRLKFQVLVQHPQNESSK